MRNDRWDKMFDGFERDYPNFAIDAISWWPSGQGEITIEFKNKTRAVYRVFGGTIRFIRNVERTEETWRTEFGHNLRHAMNRAGMQARQLALLVGVSPQMISRYCNGKSTPSYYIVERIADVLGCSMSELTETLELN